MTLRALITNDDGIGSAGLRCLAAAARRAGLEVVVAAPREESSGSSASLTALRADGRVVIEQRELDGLDGVAAYGVAATPAFITLIATRGAFGESPDLVLSGINRGANTGNAILHSGTVGAVLTASTQGCRGVAVSMANAMPANWDTAEHVVGRVLPYVIDRQWTGVLNVNVPDVTLADLKGIRRARLAPFGAVQTAVSEVGRGYVKIAVSDIDAEDEPGTDATLLAAGYATLTSLDPICETTRSEIPDSVEITGARTRPASIPLRS